MIDKRKDVSLLKRSKLWTKIVLFGAIGLVAIYAISLQMQLRTLVKERDELKEVVDDYKISIAEMELELELPKQEYIEKYAREVLGYHKHSDIIFEEKTN